MQSSVDNTSERVRENGGGAPMTLATALAGWRPWREEAVAPDGAADVIADDVVVVPQGEASFFQRLLLNLAAQDWLLLAYLTILFVEVLRGGGERRALAVEWLGVDIAVFVAVLVLVRGRILTGIPASLLYRPGSLVPLLGSFFQLQYILPTTRIHTVDDRLYQLDLRIFGFEPSEAWDRFVNAHTTEWFAFFYYGYFFIVAAHVLPVMFFGRNEPLLRRLAFGFMWVYAVGHVTYTFVPAYGPYEALHFNHELQGSFWWPLVKATVSSVDGAARTDVFPSLHTAVPTFLTLFSFKNRNVAPYKYTWLPLGLFTTQIICATMFLRWHYLIDICAGITVATSAILLTPASFRFDDARIRLGGLAPWPRLFPWKVAAKVAR